MAKATTLYVNIANTIGQTSAIDANGGPIFQIEVTSPVRHLPPANDGSSNDVPGFGRVISGGPVNGHEILFTAESII